VIANHYFSAGVIMKNKSLFFLFILFLTTFVWTPKPEGSEILWNNFMMTTQIDGQQYALEAMAVRPDSTKKLPLAVIAHGSPPNAASRKTQHVMSLSDMALEFAQRGYVALAFLRRGYGKSSGQWSESWGSTKKPQFVEGGRGTAADLRAAIDYGCQLDYVDPDKIIVVGHSAGGFGSIALASEAVNGLSAVINFAGGRGSKSLGNVAAVDSIVQAFGTFGKTARVPSLWIYAKNDGLFGPALSQKFFLQFTNAGGQGDFIMLPPFGDEGHDLFIDRRGIDICRPHIDRFLRKHSLPTWDSRQEPAMQKLPAPPHAGSKAREAWQTYLSRPGNKAYVISKDGNHYGYKTRQNSIQSAIEGAKNFCRDQCFIYSINDEIFLPNGKKIGRSHLPR
tara:strand:- start:1792 stop:2970 length:1179 start_codon:yes stop_codon:yes gene_type:complete